MNRVTLVGNSGSDAELKYTQGGVAFCKFRLATNERVKKGETYETVTEWHNCVLWGKAAESFAPHIVKGKWFACEGGIRYTQFQGDDGQTRYMTEIHLDSIEFVGPKQGQR